MGSVRAVVKERDCSVSGFSIDLANFGLLAGVYAINAKDYYPEDA